MIRALVLAAALSACTQLAPEAPAGGPAGWILPGSEWRLVELNGEAFPARLTATLTEDGRIVGQAPCNRFNAAYEGRWPDLTFRPLATTRMACPDLDAEARAFAALGAVNHGENGPDGLVLTGPGGVRLRFEPAR